MCGGEREEEAEGVAQVDAMDVERERGGKDEGERNQSCSREREEAKEAEWDEGQEKEKEKEKERELRGRREKRGEEDSSQLLSLVHTLYPSSVWAEISPSLFSTFWSLSLVDIYVPTDKYSAEIEKLKREVIVWAVVEG